MQRAKSNEPDTQFAAPFQAEELQATTELTLHDADSKKKLEEIKHWLIDKIETLNTALSALDQIANGNRKPDIVQNAPPKKESPQNISKLPSSQVIPAGSELFSQGSRAREIYSIEKGLVKLIRREPDGKEVIGAIRYPGWLLGIASVILNEPLPMTAVTVTRCNMYRIPAEEFCSLIKRNPDLSWKLHRMMAREVHNQVTRLTGIECLSARQRLEEFMWLLISAIEFGPLDKPVRLQFPAKHFEIAQFLAVTPQYLSWLIGQMEKERLVKRDKGWLIVSQPEKLWHRAGLQDPANSAGLTANDIVLYR